MKKYTIEVPVDDDIDLDDMYGVLMNALFEDESVKMEYYRLMVLMVHRLLEASVQNK